MAGTPSRLVEHVMQAGELLRRLLDRRYSHCELNGPRVEVLETIASMGADGCTQTALAGELGAAESSVSTIVERMRRDGLLLRMRSRLDRRCSVLLLTEHGSELLRSVLQDRDDHLCQWISQLSRPEQEQLVQLLDRLLQSLSDHLQVEKSAASTPATSEWGEAA